MVRLKIDSANELIYLLPFECPQGFRYFAKSGERVFEISRERIPTYVAGGISRLKKYLEVQKMFDEFRTV